MSLLFDASMGHRKAWLGYVAAYEPEVVEWL